MGLTLNLGLSVVLKDNASPSTLWTGVGGQIANTLQSWSQNDGTGDFAQQIAWGYRGSFTGAQTFDLTALPLPSVSAHGTGSPIVTLAQVRGLFVYNESATDGVILYVGNAGSNPWSACWDTATNREKVLASSPMLKTNLLHQGANPWTVDATHKNLMLDFGASTAFAQIIIWGI